MMKNILLLIIAVLAVGYIATHTSCNGKVGGLQPQVTIADLKAKQSIMADSLVTLYDVRIERCESILNYSKAIISDDTGERIMHLSDKPYRNGEIVDITGKLIVVYQSENESCLVFIDNRIYSSDLLFEIIKKTGVI